MTATEWDTLSPQAYEAAIDGSYADVIAAMQTPNVPCNCYHDDHWTGRGHLYGHPRPPVALELGSRNAICLICAEQHAAA